ncbi:hypothetical protein E1B28_010298 [Marasmius oreades]|uniref:1-alkyl-2-acetylglycerophosphocholine esterase n=1 Tax=Marasmius oreades TaxID=181124 RepID=A0A9P7URC2_9AGAR|nr:uncharacterized protein E1B28_010298 [Marasmius oreades]KAG7091248.1 hypothetical protein E1B28_010298 [Marasmius oreades]
MKRFLLLAIWTILADFSEAISLWDSTGPYHVGYIQQVLNHTTPNDPTTPGDILLLTIYYPTPQIPNTTVPYVDPITAKLAEETFGLSKGSMSTLTTRLQFEAPTLLGTRPEFGNGTSPYPTIIFLPGLGLPCVGYTAIQSELASYGYNVVSIDHPGEAPFIQLPYGGRGIPGSLNESAPEVPRAVYDYRVSDVLAVMSEPFLPSLIRTYGIPINTTHFGIFGHSIGGAGAAGVMAANDTKIASLFKVGGNMDGTFIQYLNDSTPVTDLDRPFMELAGEQHFYGSESSSDSDPTWKYFNNGQSGWRRSFQVNGTMHLDFSDIPLWVERLGQEGTLGAQLGKADGVRTTYIVASILRKLFGFVEGRRLDRVDRYAEKVPELFVLSENRRI